MSHFAKVSGGIALQVIVADQSYIDSGRLGDPALWIRTSYNTSGGVHKMGLEPLRKNFAGIGYIYDSERDAFIPPKPFASWLLDESTCLWQAPTPMPDDGNMYMWDEETISWIEAEN